MMSFNTHESRNLAEQATPTTHSPPIKALVAALSHRQKAGEREFQDSRRMCPSERTPSHGADGASDFRQAFDVLDADRDGRISREDLKTFYSGFSSGGSGGSDPSDEDISYMIMAADSDRDGYVEFDEFARVLGCRRSTARSNGVMDEVFMAMDKDGDGKVGFEDLKGYMSGAGLPVDDEDIMAMIIMAGGDGVEGVSFERLLRILAVDFSGQT